MPQRMEICVVINGQVCQKAGPFAAFTVSTDRTIIEPLQSRRRHAALEHVSRSVRPGSRKQRLRSLLELERQIRRSLLGSR